MIYILVIMLHGGAGGGAAIDMTTRTYKKEVCETAATVINDANPRAKAVCIAVTL